MFKIGPAGDSDGVEDWDEKDRNVIAQIFISHGDRIHSLQFQFFENGTLVLSDKHGRDGYSPQAPKFSAVKLNYPSELITGISGYSGKRDYIEGVTSIIFTTNNATYGPFGCPAEYDIAFDYQMGGHNKFCGFHGTADYYLYSIGVYMEPMMTISNPNPSRKPLSTASNLRMDKKIADLLSEQDPDALEGFKKTNAQSGTDVSIIHQNNYTIAAVKILTEYIEESSQKQIDLLQQLLNKVSTKKSR